MKKLINKLKIPILAGAFVLFSSSDPNKDKAEDIKANFNSGAKYAISKKGAEKRLPELAKTAYEEDAWVYFKEVLMDVGMDVEKDKVKLDLGRFLFEYFNSKDTLYRYHIHPLKAWGEKVEPPSGQDFITDGILRDIIDVEKGQIISKVFDASGEWTYSSNSVIEKPDSAEKEKILRSIYYVHCEAFPGDERTEEDIEFFIKRIEDLGFKVKYKKIR